MLEIGMQTGEDIVIFTSLVVKQFGADFGQRLRLQVEQRGRNGICD